tara:strand:- start:402 stop:551 length:150 start_codon:yes stop_codon:yes gene_type:complete
MEKNNKKGRFNSGSSFFKVMHEQKSVMKKKHANAVKRRKACTKISKKHG